MNKLATTKLSSKGQVVIPEDIRNKMGLHTGDRFVVVFDKDVLIFKMITQPALNEFQGLLTQARIEAKKAGVTKQSIKDAIKEARKK